MAPTRVLDIEPDPDGSTGVVVVARPADIAPDGALDARLTWANASGRISRPVRIVRDRRPYGPVWALTPTGAPVRRQERRHFRATMSVPVRFSWADPAEGTLTGEVAAGASTERLTHAEGLSVDLSEGGVLALLRGTAPAVGSSVAATLRIDGEELHSPATVVRHVGYPNGSTGVGVMFPDPCPHADRLRRAAFEAERRRLGRASR